jgi:hypothetical protein
VRRDGSRTHVWPEGRTERHAQRISGVWEPPYWARRQSDDYVVALRTLGTLFDRGATKLGEPVITPAEAQDYEADLARATRAERKAIRKLLKSIGAVPTVPGREGGEAPTEDESQAA